MMGDYFLNLKKHFKFSTDEISSLIIVILLFGFALGYDDGYSNFELTRWFLNLISSIVMVGIVIITHEVARKMAAIKKGYIVDFKPQWILILPVVIISFITRGKLAFILPATGMFVTMHDRMRLGRFRPGHNYYDNAFIAFMGCYANIIMALFLKSLSFLPNQAMIVQAIQLNVIYAILNLIPFDFAFVLFRLEKADIRKHPAPMDGTYLIYASRIFYAFVLGVIIVTSLVLMYFEIIPSLIIGLIMGGIISLIYGILKEGVAG
jgi:hypothetical protein